MVEVVVAGIAADLVKGLISGIGGKLGAAILDAVFPSEVPTYFTDVYKEIGRIVKQEVTQNTIDDIDGKINSLAKWVKNVYIPRKRQPDVSKQDLYNIMWPQEKDIAINMIGVLQHQKIAESALPVFVIGATLHLLLLQELALLDPKAAAPDDSSYVTSVKKYALAYADYAVKMHGIIIEKRTCDSVITTVSTTAESLSCVTSEFVVQWEDNLARKTFRDSSSPLVFGMPWSNGNLPELKLKHAAKRDNYIAKVKAELSKAMNDPVDVSFAWRQLESNPLPNH